MQLASWETAVEPKLCVVATIAERRYAAAILKYIHKVIITGHFWGYLGAKYIYL